jgi:hypothetical protein
MDLEKTEARNDCAGGGQQKFNRLTDKDREAASQSPVSEDRSN